MNSPADPSYSQADTPLGLEEPVGPSRGTEESVATVEIESTVDEILGQLHEGLQKAEATMASILESIVDDNAIVLAELESALSDMEATLANE